MFRGWHMANVHQPTQHTGQTAESSEELQQVFCPYPLACGEWCTVIDPVVVAMHIAIPFDGHPAKRPYAFLS
jgi:hypothetical protein